MAEKITEVMSRNPTALQADDTVAQAARTMRDNNVGDVLVLENDSICGVVTDRDIVVRAIAEGRSPDDVTLGEICSRDLATLATTDTVDDAIRIMRENAIRRLPVLDGNTPVGIVSLGDLALERDPASVLGAVSAAPPNT
jgi:CBS domain-containing protein